MGHRAFSAQHHEASPGTWAPKSAGDRAGTPGRMCRDMPRATIAEVLPTEVTYNAAMSACGKGGQSSVTCLILLCSGHEVAGT